MPVFRIHRLKDHLRQNFRFAPHLSGMASLKPRDYEPAEEATAQDDCIAAASPYAAFFALREAPRPIQVGDVLECEDGSLKIFKFVGIEDAQWVVPQVNPPEVKAPESVHETGAAA